MFKFYTDEDGKFIQDTEGRCTNCGEWVIERKKIYGMWICLDCAESEQCEENE